jgi:hypothetical protein
MLEACWRSPYSEWIGLFLCTIKLAYKALSRPRLRSLIIVTREGGNNELLEEL